MRRWPSELLQLLLPPLCCGCRRTVPPGAALCRTCRARLGPAPGGPAPAGTSRCSAAVAFGDEAARWVHRFKYPRPGLAGLDPAARGVLLALVREAAAAAAPAQLVVPVPLHRRRLRARGFNPAALLARSVASALDLRWDAAAVVRIRDTESQTGLGRDARRRNVAGAFRARPPRVDGLRVCVVDDVLTTGSTLTAVARALDRAGAVDVQAVCAARTPPAGAAPD